MLPTNLKRDVFGQIGLGGINTQSRETWQWQPTLIVHDPNPPITIEDQTVVSLVGQLKPMAGLIGR